MYKSPLFVLAVGAFATVGAYLLTQSFVAKRKPQYGKPPSTHQQASTETSEQAKEILVMNVWSGKIYMGYGDDYADTGQAIVTAYQQHNNRLPLLGADYLFIDIRFLAC